MDAQYRRGRGRGTGGGGGYDSARGGPGYSTDHGRGRGYSTGNGRGRGYSTGHGRGQGYSKGQERGTGYSSGQGRGTGYSRGQGKGKWRGRGGEIGANGRDWDYSHSRGQGRGNWRSRSRGEICANGRDSEHSHSQGGGETHRNEKKSLLEIPDDEMDPLKLFVGNLRQNVDKDQLLAKLIPHANVSSVLIVKKKIKGLYYGYVILPTEEDVKQILNLNKQDCYLSGRKLLFRRTNRFYIPPGKEGFVRQTLSERDYDLSSLYPEKPSIHVLVDDVIMKILEYLPLRERILCEGVCRRWQAILHVTFVSSHLDFSDDYFDLIFLHVSKDMLSKMLLLKGENLKYLSLNETGYDLRKNLYMIIAQLCPNLEYLGLPYNAYFDNVKPLRRCKNLKSLSAKKCSELDDDSFKQILLVLPSLEKIDVSHTNIRGHYFNILPEGLKELNINYCDEISKENIHKISKACKKLEVLDILEADVEFLKELEGNGNNLRSLSFGHSDEYVDLSNQVKVFTELKTLKIKAFSFELPCIADYLNNLEELHIKIYKETKNMINFGKFTQLKNLEIRWSSFRKQELMSIEKCKHLQYVAIHGCNDHEVIKKIVEGCPKIKHIQCPDIHITNDMFTDINEIMKIRSVPIKISVDRHPLNQAGVLFAPEYDTKKIRFDFVDHTSSDEDSDEDVDSVDFSYSDDLYDSGDFFDSDDEMFWKMNRIDSADSNNSQ